eukprot:3981870-Prymnesium_polylepis.1
MTQAMWRRRLVASTLRAALDVRRPCWPSPCHDAPPASGLPDGSRLYAVANATRVSDFVTL